MSTGTWLSGSSLGHDFRYTSESFSKKEAIERCSWHNRTVAKESRGFGFNTDAAYVLNEGLFTKWPSNSNYFWLATNNIGLHK